MKNYIFAFLLFVNLNIFSNLNLSNNELFEEGNRSYKNGKYDKAIEYYKKIVDRGVANGYIYYNLGNAYFRNGDIGLSLLYYKKAQKFIPRNKDLIQNIKFVETLTRDRVEMKKPHFLLLIIHNLLNKFTLTEITIFTSIVFSLTFIFLILYSLRKHLLLVKNISLSLIVIFLISAILFATKASEINTERAVVLAEKIDVKTAPSNNATLEFVIHEGTEFEIIESTKEWVKIRLKDGKTGWITSGTFGKI
jgi:tetratricopeptide (TPR) repeat protein